MKKRLFVLLAFCLIATLCLSACGDGSGADTSTDPGTSGTETIEDIWDGVEGDELEFSLTVAGSTLNVVLNRDGNCYTYVDSGKTIDGEDINRPELEGTLSAYHTNYGSYEMKDGIITATLDAQGYYRFVASGKDGNALKDAYFETNLSEEYREGYYSDKGVVLLENKGTVVLVCKSEGDSYTTVSVTNYNENNVKLSEAVVNAGGSYQTTTYNANGAMTDIRDYDKDGSLVKSTVYGETGAIAYIETLVHEDGKSVTTRTDADGNVIRTEERKNKKYENGYYTENTIIENGVTIYHNVIEERVGEDGVAISSYNLLESIEGNKKLRSINYTDCKDATNNYTLSEEYVDDVLTYYFCAIEKVTVIEGVDGRQNVTYSADSGIYQLNIEYVDETGALASRGFDYSVDEYVHGDWETFEYVIR